MHYAYRKTEVACIEVGAAVVEACRQETKILTQRYTPVAVGRYTLCNAAAYAVQKVAHVARGFCGHSVGAHSYPIGYPQRGVLVGVLVAAHKQAGACRKSKMNVLVIAYA